MLRDGPVDKSFIAGRGRVLEVAWSVRVLDGQKKKTF